MGCGPCMPSTTAPLGPSASQGEVAGPAHLGGGSGCWWPGQVVPGHGTDGSDEPVALSRSAQGAPFSPGLSSTGSWSGGHGWGARLTSIGLPPAVGSTIQCARAPTGGIQHLLALLCHLLWGQGAEPLWVFSQLGPGIFIGTPG